MDLDIRDIPGLLIFEEEFLDRYLCYQCIDYFGCYFLQQNKPGNFDCQ
jgi:hypothetical protein